MKNMQISDSPTILEVKNLSKSYTNSDESKLDVLKDINLHVKYGEFICILGQSGCGKTTMLRCIAGFENYSGDIYVDKGKVVEPDTKRIMVFQEFNQLYPWKTAGENVEYPLKVQGNVDKKDIHDIANEYLSKVGLINYRNYYPHQLSGGMKQRVAIARSLAMKPKLILMDEPFASLDALTRRKLQDELLSIVSQENVSVLFVTHNIQEALILGTRYIVFSQNGTIATDELNHLKKPVTPSSKDFSVVWDHINQFLHSV